MSDKFRRHAHSSNGFTYLFQITINQGRGGRAGCAPVWKFSNVKSAKQPRYCGNTQELVHSLTLDWSGVRKVSLKEDKTRKEREISQIKGSNIFNRRNSMAKTQEGALLEKLTVLSMPRRWYIRN